LERVDRAAAAARSAQQAAPHQGKAWSQTQGRVERVWENIFERSRSVLDRYRTINRRERREKGESNEREGKGKAMGRRDGARIVRCDSEEAATRRRADEARRQTRTVERKRAQGKERRRRRETTKTEGEGEEEDR